MASPLGTILLISSAFPPSTEAGAERWEAFVPYLISGGWRLSVLSEKPLRARRRTTVASRALVWMSVFDSFAGVRLHGENPLSALSVGSAGLDSTHRQPVQPSSQRFGIPRLQAPYVSSTRGSSFEPPSWLRRLGSGFEISLLTAKSTTL